MEPLACYHQNVYLCCNKSILFQWNPFNAKEVAAFREHTDQVYEACWSKYVPEMFASVAGKRTIHLTFNHISILQNEFRDKN